MSYQLSNAFSVQVADAPAWFTAMQDKTWAAIAGGPSFAGSAYQKGASIFSLTSGLPYTGSEGPSAIINDWTGGCASQTLREVYLPGQGGHSGLYDNWILALNLGASVPGWQLLWKTNPQNVLSSELGYNPAAFGDANGAPRTSHGWFSVFCDKNNRIWMTMIDANPSGDWGTNCYSIDRTNLSGGWIYHGRLYPSIPGGSPGSTFGWQSGAGAYDAVNHKIWRRADIYVGQGVISIDCAKTLAAGAQSFTAGTQTPGCATYENVDNPSTGSTSSAITTGTPTPCWLAISNSVLQLMDLSSPSTFANKSASGTVQAPGGCGAVWCQASNSLLTYEVSMGASIGKLTLTGSDPRTGTYAWSSVPPAAGNTVTPSADTGGQYNGTFSKFQMIVDMGAPEHKSALVVMCGYNGPTYVYKVPSAGL